MTNHTAILTIPGLDRKAQILPGNTIIDFRGDEWVFRKVTRGATPGRSAKVLVTAQGSDREFYSTVFPGLEIISEEVISS